MKAERIPTCQAVSASTSLQRPPALIRVLMAFLLAFCITPCIPTHAAADEIPEADTYSSFAPDLQAEAVENELVITYKDEPREISELNEITSDEIDIVEQETAIAKTDGTDAVDVIQVADGSDIETAIDELVSHPDIVCVEPNYIFHTMETSTNDPDFSQQHFLESSGFTKAWDSVKCEGAVTVAVLDDGCAYNLPDLADNIDVAHAYDALTRQPLQSATSATNSNHGTNVASVIAAKANNSTQIAGASYNAKILPINVFDRWGDATYSTVLEAFSYVKRMIDTGAVQNLKVINASFGAYAEDNIAAAMHSMIAQLKSNYNVLTIGAGGNGDEKTMQPILKKSFPADYDECISVTSTTMTGANSSWSDYNEYKDLSAPGERIPAINMDNSPALCYGTSFSTPIVSSAAALIFAANPSLSAVQVENALKLTATPITGNIHTESGSKGALNVNAAVTLAKSGQAISDIPMPTYQAMYRLYNPNSGEHFYTASEYERDVLDSVGWNYEGLAWNAPFAGRPVYRLYNPNVGDHHYTPDANERNALVQWGWIDEGIGWNTSVAESVPLYRLYNPNARTGTHHYTTSFYEALSLNRIGWNYEGIGWYGSN